MLRHLFTGRRSAAAGVMLLLLAAAAGCGGSATGSVSGKITYKGKALSSGAIVFHGPNGQVDSSAIGADGEYLAGKVPVGDVKVTVVAHRVREAPRLPRGKSAKDAKSAAKGPASSAPTPKFTPVPPKYNDPETASLVYKVTGGRQTIDIDLTP